MAKKRSAKLMNVHKEAQANGFDSWMQLIENETILHKSLDARMDFVLAGLRLGVNVSTALNICYVEAEDLGAWMEDDRKRLRWERAISYANAKMEMFIFKEAQKDARIALAFLKERQDLNLRFDKELGKASKKKPAAKMSDMLSGIVEGEIV